MYNSIYPVNINYTKHNQYRKQNSGNNAQSSVDNNQQNQNNTFPNGTKVAIDYTKGQINISQVLTDFRSTILAINAPDDVRDEVYTYLNLVEKESLKENPSREIIIGNLKNASKISDNYIATALKKPSNVVEKWIETLFLQKINLKADPTQINPDFQLEFPKKAQEKIDNALKNESVPTQIDSKTEQIQEESFEEQIEAPAEIKITNEPIEQYENDDNFSISSNIEYSQEIPEQEQSSNIIVSKPKTAFEANCQADKEAKILFSQAKNLPQTNQGDIEAINLLNEALGIISQDENSNQNIKAAIHIERGKIFDSYDYVDYALRDYHEATKASDYNLKAQAHYKSGQIYDEFSEFYPAMDNYLSSIAYSAEAENPEAQSKVLSKISGLYAKQFDAQNAIEYSTLAIETAKETKNEKVIADSYSKDAQNSQYLGENDRALDSYKTALSIFSRTDESYEVMAYNYEQAAIVMRKLGNFAKAAKLQSKADQYYQKLQLAKG